MLSLEQKIQSGHIIQAEYLDTFRAGAKRGFSQRKTGFLTSVGPGDFYLQRCFIVIDRRPPPIRDPYRKVRSAGDWSRRRNQSVGTGCGKLRFRWLPITSDHQGHQKNSGREDGKMPDIDHVKSDDYYCGQFYRLENQPATKPAPGSSQSISAGCDWRHRIPEAAGGL